MSSAFRQTVRGMRDLLPDEAEKLRAIEQTARNIAKLYGYREVITPIMEHYELLAAKIGEENRKRMYAFEDLAGRKVALRPEFTASIARLVATKMTSASKPIRFFSAGSLYRYDEPQFGRYREFWQVNYELIGSNKPEADAEIIALTNDLVESLGLKDFSFKINHIGILRSILNQEGVKEEQQNNIMQLLDKKQWDDALNLVEDAGGSSKCLSILKNLFEVKGEYVESNIQEISSIVKDYAGALEAVENLSEIFSLLETSIMEKRFLLEAGFARGLEYYTGMIFEIYVPEMNIALGGGGRYDRLMELFGGESAPAVGVALGTDRLSLAQERQGLSSASSQEEKILVIPISDSTVGEAFKFSTLLRKEGISTELEVMRRSVSRALSDADKKEITYVIIIGPEETKEGKIVLRNMKKRTQEKIEKYNAIQKLKASL
ncbi:MAG: histidine--tRNA ligase [Candidatus Bathyarchaeia archaeon]